MLHDVLARCCWVLLTSMIGWMAESGRELAADAGAREPLPAAAQFQRAELLPASGSLFLFLIVLAALVAVAVTHHHVFYLRHRQL